jgi:hypothetical protein
MSVYEDLALDEVVGSTNIDFKDIPPSVRILRGECLPRRHKSATRVIIIIAGEIQRTFIHGANRTSVSHENVETTEAGDGGGNYFFCPFHIAHVGGEGEDLRGRVLAKDRIFARIEGSLCTGHQRERGTSAGILQRSLGTDPTRCARDQHNLIYKGLCIIVDLGIDRWIDTWVVSAGRHEETHEKTVATYS